MTALSMEIEIERKTMEIGKNVNIGKSNTKAIEISKKVDNALFPLQWHGLVVIAIRI